ncbi:mitochondrial import inner membrane translocase subunit TIM22, partial [Trifolium pratense]
GLLTEVLLKALMQCPNIKSQQTTETVVPYTRNCFSNSSLSAVQREFGVDGEHKVVFIKCLECFDIGAVFLVLGGPKAACMGCAGFAAFSVVIEKFLERHQ